MSEMRTGRHAGCGVVIAVPVPRETVKTTRMPYCTGCGREVSDARELLPRGSAFTPDRRFMPSLFADIRTARAL